MLNTLCADSFVICREIQSELVCRWKVQNVTILSVRLFSQTRYHF